MKEFNKNLKNPNEPRFSEALFKEKRFGFCEVIDKKASNFSVLNDRILIKESLVNKRLANNFFRFTLFLAIVLFLFIIQINQISSIGITPGRTTLNFEPGLKKEIQFSVLNMEHKEMNVVFIVRGELNESITLSQAFAKFLSLEESKSFSYIVNLPQKIERPGLYEAEIMALELPKDIEEQGTFVGATVGVILNCRFMLLILANFLKLS